MLKWDDSLSVGNFEIDTQHQMFVALINRISTQMARGTDKRLLENLLRELLKYAEFHFISEENMMAASGYPGVEHRKEHQALLAELRNRLFSMQQENIDFEKLFAFLVSWFKEHTATVDRELAKVISPSR
jgi:hemerythrin